MSHSFSWLEPHRGNLAFWKILLPLLTIDLSLVAMYLLLETARWYGLIESGDLTALFSVAMDRTIPEFFQYFKWLFIATCLAICSRHSSFKGASWLSLVFFILLLDDAASIHEGGGALLVEQLSLQPALGLRARDFGELIIWLSLGIMVIASIVLGLKQLEEDYKPDVHRLCVALAALVGVGVGVDMLHIVVVDSMSPGQLRGAINLAFNVVEDGGEMVLASYAVALTFALAAAARALSPRANAC